MKSEEQKIKDSWREMCDPMDDSQQARLFDWLLHEKKQVAVLETLTEAQRARLTLLNEILDKLEAGPQARWRAAQEARKARQEVKVGIQERYFLIKHDPAGRNLEYLYWHSTVVEVVGADAGKAAVGIVRTRVSDEEDVEYLANYQWGRFHDGYETRTDKIMLTIEEARAEAELVVASLRGHV